MADDDILGFTQTTNPGSGAGLYVVPNALTSPVDRFCLLDDLFKSRTGNHSVLAYASLSAAVTAIGATPAVLEIPASMAVTADLTIPETLTLIVMGVGEFNVSSTKTLTINGPLIAPFRQIFTGSGSVILGKRIAGVNPFWFGGAGNARQVTDGAMTSGTQTLTSATAAFTAADIGKVVDIQGAGASAADLQGVTSRHNLVGTITGYTNSTTVTVSVTASATISGKTVTIGTDDTSAVTKAKAAMSSNAALYFPRGKYLVNSAALAIASNTKINGDGKGATVLYYVGPTRNGGSQASLISVGDGVDKFTLSDLSILGTNVGGIGNTSVNGLTFGVRIGTGATGAISNITIRNCEIAYIWGMGIRTDGDVGDQAADPPTNINFKILDCDVHHCSDNGINPNTGGGLLVRGCHLTDNGGGGLEFAGSRFQMADCYVARNRNVGVALGGLGNPSLGKDVLLRGNLIERNGNAGSGAGVQIGGNVVHAIISNNIIRENELQGIGCTDGTPDFASLSRDIRITGNQIVSNGNGVTSFGISVNMNDVVISDNDIFNDPSSSYVQTFGIGASGDGVKLLRNRVRGHTTYDYTLIQATNILLDRDDTTSTLQEYEPNGLAGTVDTSGTTVTYKTGNLFSTRWVGTTIKIDATYYSISAVAAAPTGTFTVSGLTVTRSTGTNFDSAWIGQYIQLGDYYFPISAVADASHLTITNPIGVTVPASGTWTLKGSVSLTLTTSAGSLTGEDYVIPPNAVYRPNNAVMQTVPFQATPVFNADTGNTFFITLTANVTSSQIVNGVEGQIVTFVIRQDPASARTFAWPSNVFGETTIGTTLSGFNVQSFRKVSAFWFATGAGVLDQG
jgi:hypothetical protein